MPSARQGGAKSLEMCNWGSKTAGPKIKAMPNMGERRGQAGRGKTEIQTGCARACGGGGVE